MDDKKKRELREEFINTMQMDQIDLLSFEQRAIARHTFDCAFSLGYAYGKIDGDNNRIAMMQHALGFDKASEPN